ncbi:hypothetical protein C8A01DRAFT_21521, partial [Parachaetomium inaequale]
QHKQVQHKSRSVADLRKAFEREYWPRPTRVSSASLPSTPKQQTQPENANVLGRSGNMSTPRRSWLNQQFHRPGELANPVPSSRIPEPSNTPHARQHLRASTIRQAEGKALRASLLDELSRTIARKRGEPVKHGHVVGQTLASMPASGSSDSHTLLLSRTLSVSTHTVGPGPKISTQMGSPIRGTRPGDEHRSMDPQTESRKAIIGPSSSPYLQPWRTRKDRGSMKSSPSLPILVSTTISASTGGAIPQSSSSVSLTAGRAITEDGPAENLPNALVSEPTEAGESPVRDRVRLYERISRPLSTEGSDQNSIKRSYGAKPLGLGRRLASQTLRSFSLRGRRKLSATKGQRGASKEPRKREPSFSFRATLRKISKSNQSAEGRQPTIPATAPRPRASPSLELLNKTAKIAPRPFYTTRPRPNHLPPSHKSHGSEPPSNPIPQHPAPGKPPSVGVNTNTNMSWGRRAAAAALDLGRRWNFTMTGARKASSSSGLSRLSHTVTLVNGGSSEDFDGNGGVGGKLGGKLGGSVKGGGEGSGSGKSSGSDSDTAALRRGQEKENARPGLGEVVGMATTTHGGGYGRAE